ncbi:DUF4129 domain-containing protein [Myxococcus llanfairpwllgwyngyllgogerychwyrndrobwllllantysiliogogogochensis]|uniref:DUF4129 domain-containing protein n=1 Tax=Myxococcus llanfairpwllgwyngyllgogerychwyrndrobwllllantysiliogogogochensis TaxID=2590453 RepID=A0A540X1F8_9BACT|nr:DUF4129 domain-containing protein [Myxococcus llanfairpwllgwyngyllgogerychwyrndrobwllllantysiliogogogochensis]TQF15023.1 DUF4129 domain-containing protein [Myxococcus llanfairpwllgwyngyllgogerychwyrndrobwllllantysiliogogogochensis]
MPSLPLLLLLASLPCDDREATARALEETARSRPAEVSSAVEELGRRMGGMPLPPADEDATAPERARQVADFLEQACALEKHAATSEEALTDLSGEERERLKAVLDRPEFSRARQRHGDVVKQLLRKLEAWLEGLFESREAQGFAVATRAVMLGFAIAMVLWGALKLRSLRLRRNVVRPGAAEPGAPLVLDAPPEHLKRARSALAADSREAIREALLAMLSSLEERRLARPDRVKTNRELAAELPARGAPASITREVERLVTWYDAAFYSLTPVPEAEATRFVESVERLHGTLGTEVAA